MVCANTFSGYGINLSTRNYKIFFRSQFCNKRCLSCIQNNLISRTARDDATVDSDLRADYGSVIITPFVNTIVAAFSVCEADLSERKQLFRRIFSVNTFVGSAKLTGFLADKWDKRIAHVIEVGPGVWEFWCFDPGKAPILAEVIRE
jgi:hypothetical protein